MKIRPVGAELFHADRRTDMKKLTVAFSNFANAPPKYTAHMKWHFTTECQFFYFPLHSIQFIKTAVSKSPHSTGAPSLLGILRSDLQLFRVTQLSRHKEQSLSQL